MFAKLCLALSAGTTSSVYFLKSLAFIFLTHGLGRENYLRGRRLRFFHIRDVDGAFPVKNRAVRVLLALLDVLLDHLQTFDNHALLLGHHMDDLAAFAFFFAGDDSDLDRKS